MTKGIETRYAGHLFRSRLEARWACFFDMIGWTWTYEPLDANGYIPDFLIHGNRPMLVEVKPASCAADLLVATTYVDKAIEGHWSGDTLMLGIGPMAGVGSFRGATALGLLGEDVMDDVMDELVPREYEDALFTQCCDCGRFGVYHGLMSYATRPCGHHDGDHYLSPVDMDKTQRLWGAAHEATRWVGSRS